MRTVDHLHAAYAETPVDPCLHGIARGLGLLYAADGAPLPDALGALVGRLTAREARDGAEREAGGAPRSLARS